MIFFDHIKGCSRDTTAYDKGLWTWIQFARDSDSSGPYPEIIIAEGSNGINKVGSDGTTKNFLIDKGSFSTADEKVKTLGHIITDLGPAQTIGKNLTIAGNNTLYVHKIDFDTAKFEANTDLKV